MKANCWMSKNKVEVREVPDPQILNARDAIVRITSTAICGSDLHLYDGFIPSMMKGDILGHEFMGEVIEVGSEVKNLQVGDRVVVPFPIACGACWSCQQELYSLCENSNPNAALAKKLWGHSPAGIFGYSHLTGGYAGGQAQYARVPFWLLKLHTLREATLHAQYLWERWQAQLTRPSKARTQDLRKRGELLLAHSQEAQAAWASVLHELALAEQAYDHFLPADAQWLAARMYQHYPQILHATERVRSVVEA